MFVMSSRCDVAALQRIQPSPNSRLLSPSAVDKIRAETKIVTEQQSHVSDTKYDIQFLADIRSADIIKHSTALLSTYFVLSSSLAENLTQFLVMIM